MSSFCSKPDVSVWFMYALVTNPWDSDLHLNSILLPPISVAKLCSSSQKASNSKAGSASANQPIISTFEPGPQVGLKSRVLNEAKNEAKTRPENSFGNSSAPKERIHNKTTAAQQQFARCRATCKHVTGFARRSHEWARMSQAWQKNKFTSDTSANTSQMKQNLLIRHYCVYYATAPQQLNACWGDFPGKSPPTKRKILDRAGWVH